MTAQWLSGIRFEEILTSSSFRYFLFPLGSAFLGVFVKHASRNDQYSKFRKEDLAVGLQLMLTACLMVVVVTTDRSVALVKANTALTQILSSQPVNQSAAIELQKEVQHISSQLTSAGWWITIMFFGLWSMCTIVRQWGWKSETEMTAIVGIALPLAFGILCLITVVAATVT